MKMEIVFASTNKGKIREVQKVLYPHIVKSLDDINFYDEIIEDGNSFEENALIKARTVFKKTGLLTLADDSGICVEALNGEPGIYSARYAKTRNDDDNNKLLIKNLQGISNRNAKYVCALAAIFPDGNEKVYIGEFHGKIIDQYRGNGGFGYDPIFYIESLGKTAAEISLEEKNLISHRGIALRMFKEDLDKQE